LKIFSVIFIVFYRKASAVVGYLDQIHKLKKRGCVANTLIMEQLINQVGRGKLFEILLTFYRRSRNVCSVCFPCCSV